MINCLREWRKNTNKYIEEYSGLQKKSESQKDFEMARYWGDCKRKSLKDLKYISGKIIIEEA